MNSFRELLESPDVTEEIIRFRGVDWVTTPSDKSNYITSFDEKLGKWIPLFVEICDKRFLYHKNYWGNHIGRYTHASKFIPLLAEIGGIEWISEKCEFGYPIGSETIEFLANLGGKSWVSQVDNEGGGGIWDFTSETRRILIS